MNADKLTTKSQEAFSTAVRLATLVPEAPSTVLIVVVGAAVAGVAVHRRRAAVAA